MSDSQILNVMQRDFSEDFRDALQSNLMGAYDRSYENILRPAGAFIPQPTQEHQEFNYAMARRSRRGIGMSALISTAQECKIPIQIKRLECNGQMVAIAQLGQILVIAEPFDHVGERPDHTKYKEKLAASHFASRQIEMDFRPHVQEERFRQRIDSRNTMLVVVRHGMRGGSFNRRDTSLAMLNIAVPDATFGSWLWKANVMNGEIDKLLDWHVPAGKALVVQEDRVTVTLKTGFIQKAK